MNVLESIEYQLYASIKHIDPVAWHNTVDAASRYNHCLILWRRVEKTLQGMGRYIIWTHLEIWYTLQMFTLCICLSWPNLRRMQGGECPVTRWRR